MLFRGVYWCRYLNTVIQLMVCGIQLCGPMKCHLLRPMRPKICHKQLRFYGTSNAYQARWEKVQNERSSLYADLLEAEALWGSELNSHFKVVFDLEHELFTSIRHYLELINPDADEAYKEAIRDIDKERRKIMYDDLSVEGDEYKKDFKTGIENIENYLKPKLAH